MLNVSRNLFPHLGPPVSFLDSCNGSSNSSVCILVMVGCKYLWYLVFAWYSGVSISFYSPKFAIAFLKFLEVSLDKQLVSWLDSFPEAPMMQAPGEGEAQFLVHLGEREAAFSRGGSFPSC